MRRKRTTRIRPAGAYVVKAAESRPVRVLPKTLSPGWTSPKPTAEDKALVEAFLAYRREVR